MRVRCAKCSEPIGVSDVIESHDGRLSHVDCKRPHTLTPEERALLAVYCSDHRVAHCLGCDMRFHMTELAVDPLSGRTNLCPRCRGDLTESARTHLYRCALLPADVQRRAREVREAAQMLVKRSQQLVDSSNVLIREAEALLSVRQQILRRAIADRHTHER